MPVLFLRNWGTLTDMTVTTLHSTPDGAVWHCGEIIDPPPSHEVLLIHYSLVFASAPVSAARFDFWVASGDGSVASEIWDGGISHIAGQITSSGGIAAALAGLKTPVDHHDWQTNHGATFQGHLMTDNFGPSWQFVVRPVGGAIASSGSYIRYRYGTIEG